MSSIISLASRNAFKRAAVAPKSAVSVCTPRFYSSGTHENDPKVLETEKHRNLSGTQHQTSTTMDHAPGWNEYLATSSEAAVKADSQPIQPQNMEELQSRTVKHIKNRHHATNSPSAHERGLDTARTYKDETVEAVYERDEVTGPLSGAGEATAPTRTENSVRRKY